MWRVSGVGPEERDADRVGWLVGDLLPVRSLDGKPVDPARVRLLFRPEARETDLGVPETLLADIERDDPDPGLHPIESWAEGAVEEEPGEFELVGTGEGSRFALVREAPEGRTAVWHDMTIAIVRVPAGYDSLQLEYKREPADSERNAQLAEILPRAHRDDFVDWRFYVGEKTPAVDGESLAKRTSKNRWRAVVRPGGRAGTLIVRFANWRGPVKRVGGDLSWRGRLRRSERAYPRAARDFVSVDQINANHDRCVIYVHGTMSCALPALDAIHDVIGANVARYEHDTFISIRHNANDLAKLVIDRQLSPRHLHFVGHSRGGLVARLAAAEVFRHAPRWGPDHIHVHTFGTPHRGTPVVGQALVELMPVLRKMQLGTGLVADARERRWRDLASMAWAYLIRGRQMPEGILEMAPDDMFLRMLESHASEIDTVACGAACKLVEAPSGTRLEFLQGLGGLFAGGANDLVVGQDSATAVGKPWLLEEPCTHFDYFLNDEVRLALEQLP